MAVLREETLKILSDNIREMLQRQHQPRIAEWIWRAAELSFDAYDREDTHSVWRSLQKEGPLS